MSEATTVVTDPHIPLAAKLGFTAFMAVMIPVYLKNYGPTNFLYFCDVAMLLTLAGLWLESPLILSVAAGILVPQLFWLVDYTANLFGWRISGMTAYMFDPNRSLFLRGISLFHGWLPLLLIWALTRTGYDPRGFPIWTAIATVLVLVSFFWLPLPSLERGTAPANVNYVYGLADDAPQTWVPKYVWLLVALVGYPLVLYLPAHLLLKRFLPAAG